MHEGRKEQRRIDDGNGREITDMESTASRSLLAGSTWKQKESIHSQKSERRAKTKEKGTCVKRNAIQAFARGGNAFFEQKKPMDRDAWEYREADGTGEI